MVRRTGMLLVLVGAALADGQADAIAFRALRRYYGTLRPGQDAEITSVRDQLVPVMKRLSPKVGKSARNVIRRGFDRKYRKDLDYLRCLCEILAAGGKPGINILYKQYKSSMRNDDLRVAMAEVFGKCADPLALTPLLKMMHDKKPKVAAAAVKGAASYYQVKESRRKDAVKQFVARFAKVTDQASGKGAETREMKMYRALKPVMNETLKAFTGETLDSAAAWKAWLAENLAKPWE